MADISIESILDSWESLPQLLRMSFLAGPAVLLQPEVKAKLSEAVSSAFKIQQLPVARQIMLYLMTYGRQIRKVY